VSGSRDQGDGGGFDDTRTQTFTFDGGATSTLVATRGMGLPVPDRYVDLGFLGSGAMGEVRRARDTRLGTVVAMKILRSAAREVDSVRQRFEAEARLTARLRHPNIVAVFDTGELDDGRFWFTMELVEGRTLRDVIDAVHGARGPHTWRASHDGWTLRRLLRAFAHVCEAVGYAHSQGIIHRDLKPRNIMVGTHGDVKVMDWGIARGPGFDLAAERASVEALPSEHRTAVGSVVGTPAYMSPEQAWGRTEALGPASDVFALGAVLYHILAGRPPFDADPSSIVQELRRSGPPPIDQVRGAGAPPLPGGLRPILDTCLAREPEDRFADAEALGRRMHAWLAEDARRDEALDLVAQARGMQPDLDRLRASAEALEAAAESTLHVLPVDAPISAKETGWHLLSMAEEKRVSLARQRAEVEERLWSALTISPGLPEARAALADIQRERLIEAEEAQDAAAAQERELWLRELDDGTHAGFLQGTGRISLSTEPAGARVRLYRYVERDRVLEPHLERELGRAPIDQVPIGRGAWLLELQAPGHQSVRLPIRVGREEHWTNTPAAGPARPVVLPPKGALGPQEIYVPAGWAVLGGKQGANALPRRRVWCEGVVLARDPITLGDWRDFLVDLVQDGRLELAVERSKPGLYRRHDGLKPREGDLSWAQLPDALARCPVQMVSLSDATAYLEWRRERDGKDWRLPTEIEWEKAARGSDGRRLPWGRHLDPALALIEGSLQEPNDAPVGSYPGDVSPYGVRDLVGGVSDLTSTPFRGSPVALDASVPGQVDPAQALAVKGGRSTLRGAWVLPEARHPLPPRTRTMFVGLRLCRTWPPTGASPRPSTPGGRW